MLQGGRQTPVSLLGQDCQSQREHSESGTTPLKHQYHLDQYTFEPKTLTFHVSTGCYDTHHPQPGDATTHCTL